MEESDRQEIARLIIDPTAPDLAKEKVCVLLGEYDVLFDLVEVMAGSEYGELPAAWGISLYLSRN